MQLAQEMMKALVESVRTADDPRVCRPQTWARAAVEGAASDCGTPCIPLPLPFPFPTPSR